MKRIGILTYHACNNYGASLQAYALQRVIRRWEPDVEIIDYQSDKLRDICDPFSRRPTHPKEIIKNCTRAPYLSALEKRRRLFAQFTETALPLSRRLRTASEVQKQAEAYACVVCGSDQTWNLDPAGRYQHPVYYLNFPKKQRRVAYATSFGGWVRKLPRHEAAILPWIRQFDHLSMRESSGVAYLRAKGLPCRLVLDPTLLLTPEDYETICAKPPVSGRYVLLFSWAGTPAATAFARQIARQYACPAITIVPPPRTLCSGIQRKLDVGPREFLSLVKHAAAVVTDSYHGTIFSIQYGKPFVCIQSGRPDLRLQSLLALLGLRQHWQSGRPRGSVSVSVPDLPAVQQRLEPLRAASFRYLREALRV